MGDASARRGLPWAGSRTSRGACRRRRQRYAASLSTIATNSGLAIARSFADARPLAHNGFKVELAQRVALRALETVGERA